MRIVEPSFSLHTPSGSLTEERGLELLRWVEWNARISHRSETAQTETSWERFIKAVVQEHADYSVIEHSSVTAVMKVSRSMSHQIVRHRLFSYTMESQRFCNYKKKGGVIEFVKPSNLKGLSELSWIESVERAEEDYFKLLDLGAKPEEARSVLPNSTAALLSMTGNLRNWRLFFMSRVSNETQPDTKRLVIPMLEEFKRCIPILFDDVNSDVKQSISLARAR